MGSARYWLVTTPSPSASLQAGRCLAGEPIMADPARPIGLVSAAASAGASSAGVPWAGRGAARVPSRGRWRRPGLLRVPARQRHRHRRHGPTHIRRRGQRHLRGPVTPGTPRRLRRACHWRAISEGQSWSGPWRTARPGAPARRSCSTWAANRSCSVRTAWYWASTTTTRSRSVAHLGPLLERAGHCRSSSASSRRARRA